MTIIEFGREVEPAMPFMIIVYTLIFRKRAPYFGFNPEKAWIQETLMKEALPILYIGLMLFIGYCTYLNYWT